MHNYVKCYTEIHSGGGLTLVKPARESTFNGPKLCASLKKCRRNLARSPLPVSLRRKKTDSGQRSPFTFDTSPFAPLTLAHKGSALPWPVDDRTDLHPRRNWCVLTRLRGPRYACACCCTLSGFPRQWHLPLACHNLQSGTI